ncbi:hypothetical protein BLOT_010340 [Blomia tropicalis]|nr:hypothetical protein BLOT_010340 [Blomia tropicalis]
MNTKYAFKSMLYDRISQNRNKELYLAPILQLTNRIYLFTSGRAQTLRVRLSPLVKPSVICFANTAG